MRERVSSQAGQTIFMLDDVAILEEGANGACVFYFFSFKRHFNYIMECPLECYIKI